MLREVYDRHLEKSPLPSHTLLTDGGAENKPVISTFSGRMPPLLHLIAQKDIVFSNAMIEHFNRTIKYRYLYRQPIPHMEQLQQVLQNAIADYNNRPANMLNGLTPLEVLHNATVDLAALQQKAWIARKERIQANRLQDCCL